MEKQSTIIIGDNTTEFGQICAEILESYGFSVKMMPKDGALILDMIKQDCPDVVILDAYMKNLDAIAVMQAVNELAPAKKPAFIVTSAYDNSFTQNAAMEQGAAYFVLKPFDLNVLMAKIQAMLRRTYDFGGPDHRGGCLHPGKFDHRNPASNWCSRPHQGLSLPPRGNYARRQ